jgi:hypothetical protein
MNLPRRAKVNIPGINAAEWCVRNLRNSYEGFENLELSYLFVFHVRCWLSAFNHDPRQVWGDVI